MIFKTIDKSFPKVLEEILSDKNHKFTDFENEICKHFAYKRYYINFLQHKNNILIMFH